MKPRFCKKLVGSLVEIVWNSPEDDWPFFTVLKVKPKTGRMLLRGADYPDGTAMHEGDEFWIHAIEVAQIRVLS